MSDGIAPLGRITVLISADNTAVHQRLRQVGVAVCENVVCLQSAANDDEIPLLHVLEELVFAERDEWVDCDSSLAQSEYHNPREILDIDVKAMMRESGPAIELIPQHQLWNHHPLRPGRAQAKQPYREKSPVSRP